MIEKIMVKKIKSKYNFNQTIEILKKAIVDLKWNISAEHNMKEKINKNIYIIELCNKKYAKEILSNSKNYWVSAMMPCRLAVCKEKDGVYVYSMNMKLFLYILSGKMKEIFEKVVKDEEKIIKSITE
jgi:uncharacterized protein (DUF302 family)